MGHCGPLCTIAGAFFGWINFPAGCLRWSNAVEGTDASANLERLLLCGALGNRRSCTINHHAFATCALLASRPSTQDHSRIILLHYIRAASPRTRDWNSTCSATLNDCRCHSGNTVQQSAQISDRRCDKCVTPPTESRPRRGQLLSVPRSSRCGHIQEAGLQAKEDIQSSICFD